MENSNFLPAYWSNWEEAAAMANEPMEYFISAQLTDIKQLETYARFIRNKILANTDWTQLSDIPDSVKLKWTSYRQALRNIPSVTNFPLYISWPVLEDKSTNS